MFVNMNSVIQQCQHLLCGYLWHFLYEVLHNVHTKISTSCSQTLVYAISHGERDFVYVLRELILR